MEMSLRERFAALARDPKRRCVGGPDRPVRWWPERVPDPETGFGMTAAAAWDLLACALENPNQELETLTMDKPPGAIGYVMKIPLPNAPKRLYMKFEFIAVAGANVICGRSFHLEAPR